MSHAVAILDAWAWQAGPTLTPISSGLINETHLVSVNGQPAAILQRLNTDIFVPQVHEDIEAITARLAEAQVPTPRLLPTAANTLWATDADGGAWRCQTLVGDQTSDTFTDPKQAHSAGTLVARFHQALAGLDWSFRSVRPGAQDTQTHLANLRQALTDHSAHRLYDDVAPLADAVFAAWERWDGPTDLPKRIIHGDLKVSNIRFSSGVAHALIDLDTLALSTLEVELGDALRSWCNPASEDAAEAVFDEALFTAALRGYKAQAGDSITADEWASVLPGVERITLNLTARFAADALQESYFGWSRQYDSAGAHNLLRAKGQWSLCQKVRTAAERGLSAP